jgi:polysaccharide export outer membrane protein
MKAIRTPYVPFVVLALLLATAGWAAENTEQWPSRDYIIAPGDILDIAVWKNPDLTKRLTVLPDGKISFPLIGQLRAEGRTLEQLKKEMESRLSRYVPDPVLSVVIEQVNSLMIYVLGKVNRPGRFPLNSNINVLQALALAGGLNSFAERNGIKIFREVQGQTQIFEFRYDDVAKKNDLKQNIELQRGDVIVVP